jgi:hypothetical protein
MLIKGPLGDYGIAQSLVQTPGWNPLEHTDAKGGGKKRGGRFSIRGGRRRQSSPLHYMDSGLDGLNTMFPTAASMPYDPFYLGNVAQQAKNMDPNAFDPNWKNKIHNPKGGPLAGPDAYDTGYVATGDYDYDTGYVGASDYSGMSYGL